MLPTSPLVQVKFVICWLRQFKRANIGSSSHVASVCVIQEEYLRCAIRGDAHAEACR